MPKSFTYELNSDPVEALERAKQAAAKSGAIFQGDSTRGTFAATGVSGGYEISGQRAVITVVDKPFFASWSRVQAELSKFFGTAIT
jgi:hypothetical protein